MVESNSLSDMVRIMFPVIGMIKVMSRYDKDFAMDLFDLRVTMLQIPSMVISSTNISVNTSLMQILHPAIPNKDILLFQIVILKFRPIWNSMGCFGLILVSFAGHHELTVSTFYHDVFGRMRGFFHFPVAFSPVVSV